MNDLPIINERLLFNRDILNFLDFFLDRNDVYFLFGNDLFIVLGDFFDSIEILFDDFSGDSLYNFSLGIINYFSGFGHHFLYGPGFVIRHFLFIWNILNSTGAYIISNQSYLSPLNPLSLGTLSTYLPHPQ